MKQYIVNFECGGSIGFHIEVSANNRHSAKSKAIKMIKSKATQQNFFDLFGYWLSCPVYVADIYRPGNIWDLLIDRKRLGSAMLPDY